MRTFGIYLYIHLLMYLFHLGFLLFHFNFVDIYFSLELVSAINLNFLVYKIKWFSFINA